MNCTCVALISGWQPLDDKNLLTEKIPFNYALSYLFMILHCQVEVYKLNFYSRNVLLYISHYPDYCCFITDSNLTTVAKNTEEQVSITQFCTVGHLTSTQNNFSFKDHLFPSYKWMFVMKINLLIQAGVFQRKSHFELQLICRSIV